jgi:anti-anti-sigma factor
MAGLDSDRAAEVSVETTGAATGTAVVAVSGELDISNVQSVRDAVSSAFGEGATRIVFDLGGLRFMDSAGIAMVVAATEKADAVTLRDPSPIVRRVIELTGLTELLPIEP